MLAIEGGTIVHVIEDEPQRRNIAELCVWCLGGQMWIHAYCNIIYDMMIIIG